MGTKRREFYSEYVKALREGVGALFIGAGLSKPAGFINWKELMHDVAADLELDLGRETDLVAVAQYHVNANGGNRGKLNQLLIEEFAKNGKLTDNHRLIAQLPIKTIWTTNYDRLIERAFQERYKVLDVKYEQPQLAITMPGRHCVLYKMHGDCEHPDKAVLTKQDYELYNESRPLFSEALKGDLVSKTFLFVGFSFEDPNIDYILSRIRVLMGQNQRPHYCVLRNVGVPENANDGERQEAEYRQKKLRLRVDDLQRYSIKALLVDDYQEVTDIFHEVNRRIHLQDVFVSGSAQEYGTFGAERMHRLSCMIGESIISHEMNLVSGFGYGIGSSVIVGAMNASVSSGLAVNDRLRLHPFPQGLQESERKALYPRIREQMIETAGFVVFIAGNNLDANGSVVDASGVLDEFEIAVRLRKYPIPIGCTGYAARRIWQEVGSKPDKYYPRIDIKKQLDVLGDPGKSDNEIVGAVFEIIRRAIEA